MHSLILYHCFLLLALPLPSASVLGVYTSRGLLSLHERDCVGCVEGASCICDNPISSGSSSKVARVPRDELCPAEAALGTDEVVTPRALWERFCTSVVAEVLQPRRVAARRRRFAILCNLRSHKCTHINNRMKFVLRNLSNLLQGNCLAWPHRHRAVEIPRCHARFA